jgi:hypothetical protein
MKTYRRQNGESFERERNERAPPSVVGSDLSPSSSDKDTEQYPQTHLLSAS